VAPPAAVPAAVPKAVLTKPELPEVMPNAPVTVELVVPVFPFMVSPRPVAVPPPLAALPPLNLVPPGKVNCSFLDPLRLR
jgi:hypothetical protein